MMALELRDPEILKKAFNTLPFKRKAYLEKTKLKDNIETFIKSNREGCKAKQIIYDKIVMEAVIDAAEEIIEKNR